MQVEARALPCPRDHLSEIIPRTRARKSQRGSSDRARPTAVPHHRLALPRELREVGAAVGVGAEGELEVGGGCGVVLVVVLKACAAGVHGVREAVAVVLRASNNRGEVRMSGVG